MIHISVIILTYNGLKFLAPLFDSIKKQTINPELIVIDSESTDGTREFLRQNDIPFTTIAKTEFDHGGTRSLGASLSKSEILIYLTQDVVLENEDSLEMLIKPLVSDDKTAMSFGRQLPRHDATALSQFARFYNYPEHSMVKSFEDAERLGIKTFFISDSFSAYKKSVLERLGNFPSNLIMCEDAYVGAKAILAGYKIAYVAEARAFHSHNYSIYEEFKRYFDIGYFYHSERWLLDHFNKAESEGITFMKNEFFFILKRGQFWIIPNAVLRNVAKYIGYKLGSFADSMPGSWRSYLSMHSYYWKKKVT
jgi:rhamnosyltransferase